MAVSDSRVLRALERLLILGGLVALGWFASAMADARGSTMPSAARSSFAQLVAPTVE